MAKEHTDAELIADLERVNNEVDGGPATATEYRVYGEYNHVTLVARFGSWVEAQAAAGEDISHRRGVKK